MAASWKIENYRDAVRLANAAGMDAANARMRKDGRTTWTQDDFDHGVAVTNRMLRQLGYKTAAP